MPFKHNGPVKYYTFKLFNDLFVNHAIFTRRGGVSPPPWDSLNVGGLVGDHQAKVEANRRRAFQALGIHPDTMYDVWQTHSAEIVITNTPRSPETTHKRADIILTNNPDVTLFMRFADCVPILLFDPVRRVVGLVHSGWRGTVKRVPSVAVNAMIERYGCVSKDILAGLGPSIGVDHYEVGTDVLSFIEETLGDESLNVIIHKNGTHHLDLRKANQILLEQAGIQRMEIANICTACQINDWYSHRGEGGRTGRFGALITLQGEDKHSKS
jgi:YfiH family protein